MGDILQVYKVYPEDPEKIDSIKEVIEKGFGEPFKINEIKKEPLAFGLEVIRVAVVFPDKVSGLNEKLENSLNSIDNVKEIEAIITTLI